MIIAHEGFSGVVTSRDDTWNRLISITLRSGNGCFVQFSCFLELEMEEMVPGLNPQDQESGPSSTEQLHWQY